MSIHFNWYECNPIQLLVCINMSNAATNRYLIHEIIIAISTVYQAMMNFKVHLRVK